MKNFWQKPTTEIIGTGEKLEGRRKGWLLLPLLFNTELEALANAIKGKEIKCLHIKEEDIKLFFPTDDMIIYAENPKESLKNLLELINNYTKFAEYKVSAQKSIAFLYTSNEKLELEIKNTI